MQVVKFTSMLASLAKSLVQYIAQLAQIEFIAQLAQIEF